MTRNVAGITFPPHLILALETIEQAKEPILKEYSLGDFPELKNLGCEEPVLAQIDVNPLGDSIWLQIRFSGKFGRSCGRCLESIPSEYSLKTMLQLEKKSDTGAEWLDDDVNGVDEYHLKIGPDVRDFSLEDMLREQLLLQFGFDLLPDLNSDGVCLVCNKKPFKLSELRGTEEKPDPRWEKLKKLK